MAIGTGTALLLGAGAGLIGSGMQAGAAERAGEMQSGAARYAADIQKQMFDIQNEQQKPYREAGYGALTRIGELLPGLTAPISREEILGLPGYQFGIEQGTGAARQMMNVGGGGSNVGDATGIGAAAKHLQHAGRHCGHRSNRTRANNQFSIKCCWQYWSSRNWRRFCNWRWHDRIS